MKITIIFLFSFFTLTVNAQNKYKTKEDAINFIKDFYSTNTESLHRKIDGITFNWNKDCNILITSYYYDKDIKKYDYSFVSINLSKVKIEVDNETEAYHIYSPKKEDIKVIGYSSIKKKPKDVLVLSDLNNETPFWASSGSWNMTFMGVFSVMYDRQNSEYPELINAFKYLIESCNGTTSNKIQQQ